MSDQSARRPRKSTTARALAIVLLGIAMVAAVIGGGWWVKRRDDVDRGRKAASSAAEARARRFASELPSAFASGPRSVDSLRPLGAEAGVDYVTAAMDGGSVVVTWESSEEYGTGDGLSPTSQVAVCMRAVISRDHSALTQRTSTIPCTAMLPFTVSTELGVA